MAIRAHGVAVVTTKRPKQPVATARVATAMRRMQRSPVSETEGMMTGNAIVTGREVAEIMTIVAEMTTDVIATEMGIAEIVIVITIGMVTVMTGEIKMWIGAIETEVDTIEIVNVIASEIGLVTTDTIATEDAMTEEVTEEA
mmetsp:Transcript_27184/g.63263  ORF Transcript_27184/g.63263 Transcript_27184/m.63263 type:complete len:142 (+) Transcript_27184:882-1307(+)